MKEPYWPKYSKSVEAALHLQFVRIIDKNRGDKYEQF